MPMIENEDNYYYDFYGLEERVSSIGTQVSEVHEDVRIVETQISELVSVQSEQFSELISVQSEQVSEIVSVMSDNAAINADIRKRIDVEIILLFAVIAVVGIVCGFVASLTWRSGKHG
ncbi:MAG: hypothetical protein HDT21_03695 [Ruminococcus sp.]|nr:hypothetical protein [Ruminococcus sp.]